VFGAGEYQPMSEAGRKLPAHELTRSVERYEYEKEVIDGIEQQGGHREGCRQAS
jgi:hypothetical protein